MPTWRPITHPEVVPVAVARALGLPDQPGRSITDTLLRLVRDRHMLLRAGQLRAPAGRQRRTGQRLVGRLLAGHGPGDQP